MSQHRASVPSAADVTAEGPGRPDSTGELVQRLSHDVTRLVKDELRLAQLEVTGKAKRAGLGAGMFGAAGLVALYGVGALVACAILALALVVDSWLAALIVGVVLLLVAGVLALVGKGKVAEATPAKPERTVESVKADVDAVKQAREH